MRSSHSPRWDRSESLIPRRSNLLEEGRGGVVWGSERWKGTVSSLTARRVSFRTVWLTVLTALRLDFSDFKCGHKYFLVKTRIMKVIYAYQLQVPICKDCGNIHSVHYAPPAANDSLRDWSYKCSICKGENVGVAYAPHVLRYLSHNLPEIDFQFETSDQ